MNQPIHESEKLREIIFLVEEDPEGGYTAKAIGEAIFTQADSISELREFVKDAVECHFPDINNRPQLIRLHLVHDEVFAS
ncbi:hypothetical protein [Synechococcus sp. PCC 6312]|uniref:hypothetical protein n=1 Tax=Synechococcus sp. (strain ATCC 27167 / PCC 6312) TaxID=195253 RepID=UPI00029F3FCF|nr:hypothetical protein [Synechococcus sp. PCC 6312]AFY61089.1 hypothetical protein Syn6312_1956 [Synechococcus sp. PCC 6312]